MWLTFKNRLIVNYLIYLHSISMCRWLNCKLLAKRKLLGIRCQRLIFLLICYAIRFRFIIILVEGTHG